MIKKSYLELIAKYLLIFLSALGVGLHLFSAFYQPIWLDEIFTLFFSNREIIQILKDIEATHPPLYYFLFKCLYSLSHSLIAMRTFHFLFFLISTWLVIAISKKVKFSTISTLFMVFLWTTSPHILYLSYQLRMYTLGLLIMLSGIFLSLNYLDRNKPLHLLLLICTHIIGFLTVYGYFFYLFAQTVTASIFALRSNQLKKYVFAHLFLFLIFSSFIFGNYVTRFEEIKNSLSWVKTPEITDFPGMVSTLFGIDSNYKYRSYKYFVFLNYWFLFVYLMLLLAYSSRYLLRLKGLKRENFTQYYLPLTSLILFSLLPILYLISRIQPVSFFHNKQLFPISIAGFFLLSGVLTHSDKAFLKLVTWLTILFFLLPFYYLEYRTAYLPPYSVYNEPLSNHSPTDYLNKNIIGLRDDIILAYYLCQATSFDNIDGNCQKKGIHLVDEEKLLDNFDSLPETYISQENKLLVISGFKQGSNGIYKILRSCVQKGEVEFSCNSSIFQNL